jgi:hypothetical protein
MGLKTVTSTPGAPAVVASLVATILFLHSSPDSLRKIVQGIVDDLGVFNRLRASETSTCCVWLP